MADERNQQEEAEGVTFREDMTDEQDPQEEANGVYFVLADPAHRFEPVPQFSRNVDKRKSDGSKVYGRIILVSEALEKYRWNRGKLDFHTLKPVCPEYKMPDWPPGLNERKFSSTCRVDNYLNDMPMYELYEQFNDEHDSFHIYCWLESSLFGSKITLGMIKRRQRLVEHQIACLDEFLDQHIEAHIAMKASESCDKRCLEQHRQEGRLK